MRRSPTCRGSATSRCCSSCIRGLGATVQGAGTPTLRIQCASMTTERPDPVLVGKLRGSVLLLGPLLARRGAARLGASGRRFSGAPHHQHPPAGARGARRGAGRRAGARAGRAERPDRRVVLSGRGVGHRHRDRAPGGGRRARPDRDPSRRDGAARRRAVHCSCGRWASSIEGIGTPTIRVEGAGAVHRRDASPAGRLRRGGQLGRGGRDHRRRDRPSPARAPRTWKSLRRRCGRWACSAVRGRSVHGGAVDADRDAPDHHRPLAGISERHGQPRHRARDPGRRPHAGARLALRAAVCSRSSS